MYNTKMRKQEETILAAAGVEPWWSRFKLSQTLTLRYPSCLLVLGCVKKTCFICYLKQVLLTSVNCVSGAR